MPRTRIMYVELKSSLGDRRPAWISRVRLSKTKRSVFFKGKELLSIRGGGVSGNYRDVETGEEYWVSGPKKNRQDRHSCGGGLVTIDDDARAEYFKLIGTK